VAEARVEGLPFRRDAISVSVTFRKSGVLARVEGAKLGESATHWLDL
jgi:hypothetical protein